MLSPTLGVSGESSSATGRSAGTSGPTIPPTLSARSASSEACAAAGDGGAVTGPGWATDSVTVSVIGSSRRAVHSRQAHGAVHLDLSPEPAAAGHLHECGRPGQHATLPLPLADRALDRVHAFGNVHLERHPQLER